MKKMDNSSIRKTFYIVLIIAAPIITGLVLGWIFTLDGTLGMYQWIPPFQYLIIAVAVLGVSAPLLALIGRGLRVLRVIAVVLGIIGILLPLLLGWLHLSSSFQFASTTPPMLLISDGTGANHVPNLALVFRTAQQTRNTLYYGENSLDQHFAEPAPVRQHVLPLKDLKPGVHYQWRLNEGNTCDFTTPAGQSTNDTLYHFAVGSDSHLSASTATSAAPPGNPAILQQILTYVTQKNNSFQSFFLTGDIVNMGSDFNDWQFALNNISTFTCKVPVRPLMGNHDSYLNGTPQYEAYLYPPEMETQTGTRLYYRIDSGNVHFIILNMLWGVDTFSPQERAWFVAQMESIPSGDWKIVMEHASVYASGSMVGGKQYYDPVDMVQQVAPLFEKYKVNLVISGHDHHLEFLQKNGVSYAVIGGAGAPLDAVATNISPASLWYLPQQHGFLDVTVHSSTIELLFRDPNGNELKSFTVNKNQ